MAPVGIEPLTLYIVPYQLSWTGLELKQTGPVIFYSSPTARMIFLVVDRQRIAAVIYTVLCRVSLSGRHPFRLDFVRACGPNPKDGPADRPGPAGPLGHAELWGRDLADRHPKPVDDRLHRERR